MPQDARSEYKRRSDIHDTLVKKLSGKADTIGNIRLVFALIALVMVLLPLLIRSSWPWWCLLPLSVVFLVIGKLHDSALESLHSAQAALRYVQDELKRLDEEWREFDADGEDHKPLDLTQAQFAADIDLYGSHSLYQLLNRTRTHHGGRALSAWIDEPASSSEIVSRQSSVACLRDNVDFREALSVAASGEGGTILESEFLVEWANNPDFLPNSNVLRLLGYLFPVTLFICLGVYVAMGIWGPLFIAASAQLLFLMFMRKPLAKRSLLISGPDRILHRFKNLIETFERYQFEDSRLSELQEKLRGDKESAAEQVRRLSQIAQKLEARHNVFFSLIVAPALLWELHWVLRSEQWQRETGPHIKEWFQVIGELEALSSLAAFAYERPEYCFPEFVSEPGVFELTSMTHPLLKRDEAVDNSVALGGAGSVLLLSGSNMSGKSTFLRSLAINQVLARMGAPVAAKNMRTSEYFLATSIRVSDSLARGASHFYAELERIKYALDQGAEHKGALLYLLDEMLHGTNSKERYIGAVSVIRWLSKVGAVGVVTTHDLALADVEDLLSPGLVTNMHFGDDVEGDEIQFDYTLKDGPVVTTNAIRLMKAVGIQVEMVEARNQEV
ncbi:MAG: hypothetical protein VYC39_04520 [Myxococcota bacterium]|nr:hypothetical protein [Myxococcota bacterium]